ncbi:Ppx/GppA family phosphatase [Kineosporia succinea]|uniref:Exopolyphosphatase/guanosine-5'-triphosphate, 3'-diphosphate pyrophosphatase n=1 Tax=Kineosporia succinea TaxID=84632 RepID=A0ABT9P306_9ACTN|nr:Ppx/GppA phosphatase family protein [Kineosporia succinea]MDP9827068.1 exopolyphosphatase/guanosine-5'-triphosphate,3'-diphosphate pyrophosphatase [Kineosporia succinea]
MRLGVLDVGSNTVHLLVVDAHPGARPLPASSHKIELRLAEHLEKDGRVSPAAEESLLRFVRSSLTVGEDLGVEEVIGFATSAVRDAPNGEELLARVRSETGVELHVLGGGDEARLTFLAVRRWFGWSAGRLLVLDIGGGSLEIASGMDELPDVAISLPLGAGRLTRDRLVSDPPAPDEVRAVRKYVRAEVGRVVRDVVRSGQPDRVVGSSKTFRTLARICTPTDPGTLRRADLTEWVPRLAAMPEAERAELPGVSVGRARQILAGALVAEAAMELLGAESMQISPWALREGVILRRLDDMMSAAGPGF